jgi:hypothetical protein
LPPGIYVGVVVRSYAGSMGLTFTAEPYDVPDADRFMSWVLEEYLSLLKRPNKWTRIATAAASMANNRNNK